MRVLSRMWQMLLKGITEVQGATRPAAAAEMVLVRIAYVADLPTPDEAIRMIEQGGGSSPVIGNGGSRPAPALNAPSAQSSVQMPSASPPSAPTMSAPRGPTMQRGSAEPAPRPQVGMAEAAPATVLKISTFPELIALAGQKRDLMVRGALESDVRLIRIEDGRLELAMERTAARSLINDLSRKLEMWTGRRWAVVVSNEQGQATIREQVQEQKNERTRLAEADPRVQAVFAKFPGAKMEVRVLAPEIPEGDDDALINDDGAEAGDDD
jgi:DNA polymerase-3 subunit gamma/tau